MCIPHSTGNFGLTIGIPVVAFDQGGLAVLGRLAGSNCHLVALARKTTCIQEIAATLESIEAAPPEPSTIALGLDLDAIARDLTRVYRAALSNAESEEHVDFANPSPPTIFSSQAGGRRRRSGRRAKGDLG